MNSEVMFGFYASEFVPPEIYNRFGPVKSWWFVRKEMVLINAELKKDFGASVIINNWKVGGQYKYSGFRPKNCKVGAEGSQHRFCNATDSKVEGYTADEVRVWILKEKERYMALGLTAMEDAAFAPTWCHLDGRWTGMDDILIVKPMIT